jgi:hypothetical protein
MKARNTSRLADRIWRFSVGGALLATGTLVYYRSAAGTAGAAGGSNVSPVIANPSPAAPLQTQDQQNQPNQMDVFQPSGAQAAQSVLRIFQYGWLQLHPHFDYQWLVGNGVQSSPGAGQSTVIQNFSPGLLVDLGPHWVFDYTPTFQFYSAKQFKDTLNHSLSLAGGFEYNEWKFGLSHSTQITSEPLVETGSQTDQTSHGTGITATRMLNSHLSADFSLNQNINLVGGYDNSYDWGTMEAITCHFGPRLQAGLGAGGGYVLVQSGHQTASAGNLNQYYEELQLQAAWRATDKLGFQAFGGFEDRQFMLAGSGDSLSPIFGLSIQYQPFKNTEISLDANRTVSSSDYYLAAQEMDITSVGVSINQRLIRRYQLGAGISYSRMDYGVSIGGSNPAAANRSDDVVSLNVRLSHPFHKRGSWSVFYQYSDDHSSQSGFTYNSNQMGFEISYAF